MVRKYDRKKILLKCAGSNGMARWEHFCYVPFEVYHRYFKDPSSNRMERFKKRIRRWAKEDFDIDIRLRTLDDIKNLREFIKNVYRHEYSELFPRTDYRLFKDDGLVALWLVRHMEMEIESNDNPSL